MAITSFPHHNQVCEARGYHYPALESCDACMKKPSNITQVGKVLSTYTQDYRAMSDVYTTAVYAWCWDAPESFPFAEAMAILAEVNPAQDADTGAGAILAEFMDNQGYSVISVQGGVHFELCAPVVTEIDASPEMQALYAFYGKYNAIRTARVQQVRAERDAEERAKIEERTARKGKYCRVVKGRKVPKGTEGYCIWTGVGQFGERVGIKDAGGTVHWTAASNCVAVQAPEGAKEAHEADKAAFIARRDEDRRNFRGSYAFRR